MLCMNNYTQAYIDECRARVATQLAAYDKLVKAVGKQPALDSFEPIFFNNLVLLLDQLFVHRSRIIEGKDGNPMNEVRVICNSLLNNNSKLLADKGIKLNPTKSILKYQVGDEIKLTEVDFRRLSDAFFASIEQVFAFPEPIPAN
jgi:hypothetical protein